MANQFRINLKRWHVVKQDEEYIADEYNSPDLPTFTNLRTCFNEKYKGTCKYCTPFNLLLREHDCINNIGFSELPEPHEFFDKLPKDQWPVWGYPHDDRLKSAKKKTNTNNNTNTKKAPAHEAPKVKLQVHVPEKKMSSYTKQAASDKDVLDVKDQPELLEGLPTTTQTEDKDDDDDETCMMSTRLQSSTSTEAEKMEIDTTKLSTNEQDTNRQPKEQRSEKKSRWVYSYEKVTPMQAL